MNERAEEFRRLVKLAHDAIDEYTESRLTANDWFVRDLNTQARRTLRDVLNFGIVENDTFGDKTFSEYEPTQEELDEHYRSIAEPYGGAL